jgi:hypothetical protein
MRALLLILLLAVSAQSQTLIYDKFTDREYYQSKQIEVYRNKGGLLLYNPARVQIQALRLLRPSQFALRLYVDSFDWQFIQGCVVHILADGKRFQIPCTVTHSDAYNLGRSVYVTESLSASMSVADYESILNSKSIEMRVGAYEFKLKDKHLKELRKVIIAEITTP